MNLYEETKFLLDKYHIQASKRLGQNFLIDENVVEDILKAAEITREDLVIEIGPGLGTLTSALLEKAKKVVSIELDDRMLEILKDRFQLYSNFTLIHGDILKLDLKTIMEKEKEESKAQDIKIVANLPYYITTPIVMKLLEERLPITSITIMIQKEVAKRLTAKPGEKEAGAITYAVSYYAKAQEKREVPHTAFLPSPEVESEVISLQIRKKPKVQVKNEKLLFQIIKAAFSQRRKTLLNSLANNNIIEKEKLRKFLQKEGLSETIRGEAFTLEQFAKLSDCIQEEAKC